MMDCLLAKCIPCITDCVMAELEKLGSKYRYLWISFVSTNVFVTYLHSCLYRLALRLAKDPRFERLPCTHAGYSV